MLGLSIAGQVVADQVREQEQPIPSEARSWYKAAYSWRLGDWSPRWRKGPDHLWLVFHGDIPRYYRAETASDRQTLDALLREQGRSALLVYPIAARKDWGGARSMRQSLALGKATFALYESLARAYGNPEWAVQTFTFSGSGRVDLALQRLFADAGYGLDADTGDRVVRFVDERLVAMNAGDAMVSKSMERPLDIPDSWIRFLEAHPHIDASFVHDRSAEYPYMFDLAVGIGRAFDPAFTLRRGQSRSIAGGRLRFWGAPSHREAWIGQFPRAFLRADAP